MKGVILPLLPSALAAAAGLLITSFFFYPGIMNVDSWMQYAQVVTSPIYNHHPPALVYVWRVADKVIAGTAGLFLLHQLLYWSALAIIAYLSLPSALGRFAMVIVVGFWPPLFLASVQILKDSGALSAFLFSAGMLMLLFRRFSWGVFSMLLIALLYGAALRYNSSLAAIPFLYLAMGVWRARKDAGFSPSFRTDGAATLAASLVLALGVYGINTVHVRPVAVWPSLAVWDIAAISALKEENLIPPYALANKNLTLPRLKEIFAPYSNTALCMPSATGQRDVLCREAFPLRPGEGMDPRDFPQLRRDWLHIIEQNPALYLYHRARLGLYLLGVLPVPAAIPLPLYNQENPPTLPLQEAVRGTDLAWSHHQPRLPLVITHLLYRMESGIFFRGWLYVALAIGVAISWWRCRSRSPLRYLGLCLLGSGVLYALPLAFLAAAADFRYLIWFVASAVLSTALRVALWLRERFMATPTGIEPVFRP